MAVTYGADYTASCTARRESCQALREARRSQTVGYVLDIENIPNQQGGIARDELLHRRAERQTRAHAGARTGAGGGAANVAG